MYSLEHIYIQRAFAKYLPFCISNRNFLPYSMDKTTKTRRLGCTLSVGPVWHNQLHHSPGSPLSCGRKNLHKSCHSKFSLMGISQIALKQQDAEH